MSHSFSYFLQRKKGSSIKRGIVTLASCVFSGSQVGQQHFSALQLMNSDQGGVKKGWNSLLPGTYTSALSLKGRRENHLSTPGRLGKRRKQMHADQKSGSLSLFKFCGVCGSFSLSLSLFSRAPPPFIYRKYFIRGGRPIPWFTEVSSWLISPPPKKELEEGVKLHRVSRQIK